MVTNPPPGTPYHRLARTDRHRWWRPPLGTALIVVITLVTMIAAMGGATLVSALAGGARDADGFPTIDPLAEVALMLGCLAAIIPAVLLAVRWVQRRPAGTVSSVTGRLRWAWLRRCLMTATPVVVLAVAGGGALSLATGISLKELELEQVAPWRTIAIGLLITVTLVPFQAAGEEYLARGWLLQAVGAYTRRGPWPGIVVSALIFTLLHGLGTPFGFAELTFYGLVMGWLTVRTGGLEAAIALHAVNNLVGFVLSAVYGGMASDATAADAPWQLALTQAAGVIAYAALVAHQARRRGVAMVVPQPPAPPLPAAGSRLWSTDEELALVK